MVFDARWWALSLPFSCAQNHLIYSITCTIIHNNKASMSSDGNIEEDNTSELYHKRFGAFQKQMIYSMSWRDWLCFHFFAVICNVLNGCTACYHCVYIVCTTTKNWKLRNARCTRSAIVCQRFSIHCANLNPKCFVKGSRTRFQLCAGGGGAGVEFFVVTKVLLRNLLMLMHRIATMTLKSLATLSSYSLHLHWITHK